MAVNSFVSPSTSFNVFNFKLTLVTSTSFSSSGVSLGLGVGVVVGLGDGDSLGFGLSVGLVVSVGEGEGLGVDDSSSPVANTIHGITNNAIIDNKLNFLNNSFFILLPSLYHIFDCIILELKKEDIFY